MITGGLFKSKRERDLEEKRATREAFRKAERANEKLRDDTGRLKKERDQAWLEAKARLRAGDKSGAQRNLQSIRAIELHIDQLEKRRWSVDRIITKLRLSRADEEVTVALRRISNSMSIEPERLDSVLADVTEMFDDQAEAERIWDSVHTAEVAGLETVNSGLPAVDAMMTSLEQEVAVDVRAEAERARHDVDEGVEAGRQRLKDLLEDQK
ncbi:MAG: hypothetical protein WB764_20590 [Xanthobacteraceae bacterium]